MSEAWPGPDTVSAAGLAAALGLPTPTHAQRTVIEAGPGPVLVVAGAGSGKTETMAARVVWLVANGHVARDEVLGLTFTRKAAGELAERIDRRLGVLDRYALRGLLPYVDELLVDGSLARLADAVDGLAPRAADVARDAFLDDVARRLGTSGPAASGGDLLLRPHVATYNAFADGIVREHGARIGRDDGATLLGQSASWLLARRVVVASRDPRLPARGEAFSSVVNAVHRLAGEILDHRADPSRIDAFAASWVRDLDRLATPGGSGDIEKFRDAMTAIPVLTGLVREYAARKAAADTLDFADQVAGALDIVDVAPEVAALIRSQYRVVLLDEYQDTSVIQSRLLAAIFRDRPVMAVGDPNQSIYAWRGASADNLDAFAGAFGSGDVARHELMISWRNDRGILTAANALVDGRAPGVGALSPRPGAGDGHVGVRFLRSIDDEADEVATWFVEARARHTASGATAPHCGAILFRAKRHMQTFAESLARAGVPHRILGLGGLLTTPEVVDVIAALRVIHDPAHGSSLIRLLTGPRFAVGVADLAALRDLAGTLSRRDAALAPLPAELAQRLRGSAGADEQLSIIDALEFVRAVRDSHSFLAGISAPGRARLREAGELFARLRAAAGQSVTDLIRLIERELRLDIELAANETRGPARVASAQLRAFVDEVRGFLDADESGTIGNLLAWLDHAEDTDELMPRAEPPQPGIVQLLTIHGSKGLEWDAVAVVRLVADELPKASRTKRGWTGFGVLPSRFRGDAAALPRLEWIAEDPKTDAKRLRAALKAYGEANGAQQESEERRLAYVAVTRARTDLLLTGSSWGGQTTPRLPSRYLAEMVEALGRPDIVPEDAGDNPYLEREGRVVSWPLDPLGERGEAVRAAAAAVESAVAGRPAEPDAILAGLRAERDARRDETPASPVRVPASRFKDYVTDFRATAGSLSRPMPERPFRQTLTGTRFHAWVEARTDAVASGASTDDALWELDDDPAEPTVDPEALAELRATFERSEWGALQPISVEEQIDFVLPTPGDAHVIVCKLDAVYERDGRIEIVDWKTGRAPTGAAEIRDRMLQLELYRHAYHARHGVPLDDIDVALFYVADDRVIRADERQSLSGLAQRWSAARSASR